MPERRNRHLTNRPLDSIEALIRSMASDPNLSVDAVARCQGLSSSYLRELAHFAFKMSPRKMIETVRLENAVSLMKSGTYDIYTICTRIGYSNTKTFRAAFEKRIGWCPSEFSQSLRVSRNQTMAADIIVKRLWKGE